MTDKQMIQISREDLRELMTSVLREEAEKIGVFSDDEKERQRLQLDHAFVRRMRESFDSAAATVGKAVLGCIAIGVLGFIVAGAKLGLVPK